MLAGGCANPTLDAECGAAVTEAPAVELVDRAALIARISDVPRSNAARLDRLRELFEAVGCRPRLSEQPVRGSGLPNLICTLPGESDFGIVVGAHFDKVEPGHGAADNWSGAALLPTLYQGLAQVPRNHTFLFVGFSDEERGELGSRAFVAGLDARGRERLVAMVNLDTLGLNTTRFELREADPTLACLLVGTAALTGDEARVRDNRASDASDHEPFREAGIPAIRLHSLTPASMRTIHSRADRLEAIDQDAYFSSYRLIANYLAVIDRYYLLNRAPAGS